MKKCKSMLNCWNIEKYSRTEKAIYGTIRSYSRLYETINNSSILYSEENIRQKVVYYERRLKRIIGDGRKQTNIDNFIRENYSKLTEAEMVEKIKEIINQI